MRFYSKVPEGAELKVLIGIEDDDQNESSYSYDAVIKAANEWNVGKYHPDVWMEIYYKEDDLEYSCDLLYNNKTNEVVGFIYGGAE